MTTQSPAGLRDALMQLAENRKGIPYRIDPPPDGTSTLDCSLFVLLTLQDAGIPLPSGIRTAEQIRQTCDVIDFDSVGRGDLLFFEKTYDAPGPAGPDGRIASHVGISLGKGTRMMWDCHASGESGPPGVGQTDISTDYWQSKIFEARTPKGIDSQPAAPASGDGSRYQVTDDGVRLRAQPSTSAEVVVDNLGAGTIVVSVSGEIVTADGHSWRSVRTAAGQIGWVAGEFLRLLETLYQVTDDGVRMRAQPSASADVVVDSLVAGTILTSVSDQVISADGHSWRNVRTSAAQAGWVAGEFLKIAETASGDLTDEPDHFFGFAALWPTIQVSAGTYSADAQVLAAIIKQESNFTNVRVHHDGTGHGLLGLDDNGLLPDFEKFSGLACGRGEDAISIPPKPQLDYAARVIAAYTLQFGSAINAARVWHRGARLWQDDLGQNYENLVREHMQTLFGSA